MTKHERIDLTQFEELMESIVICEEEYIKGQDSLLEDCQTLKDRMQIILAELKKSYETIDYLATHAMDTGDFCPMCLTSLDERCQHIIWEVDLAPPGMGLLSVTNKPGFTTTFGVWNPETNEEEQHVHYEQNSLIPRGDGE